MSELDLPACPICRAEGSLTLQSLTVGDVSHRWYDCHECGSVLLWMGGDQWAYQKIGLATKASLLKKPMSESELRRSVSSTEKPTTDKAPSESLLGTERADWTNAKTSKKKHREKPSRLLKVGIVVTSLVFVVAVVLLIALLYPRGEPGITSSIPPPAFSAGTDVYLVAPLGSSVPVFEIKEGDCEFRFRNSEAVPSGKQAMILDGRCYREKNRDYYYETEVDGSVGWVREGLIIPIDLYTPVPTDTPRPTIAPAPPSYAERCVKSGTGVAYVIEGESVDRVALTWENDMGGTNQGESGLPVCKTFTGFERGDFLYISAQIIRGGGKVRCRIYDGTQIVGQATADGFASIATCSGTAR